MSLQRFIFSISVGLVMLVASAKASPSSCAMVPLILREMALIRGLAAKSPVPCREYSRDQAIAHLKKRYDADSDKDQIKLLGVALRKLRLLPQDFNLEERIVDLYMHQVGAFYDPREKFFALATWQLQSGSASVIAHELTHALQDQEFNLTTFIQPRGKTLDEQLARQALVEGDATLAMLDHSQRHLSWQVVSQAPSIELVAAQLAMSTMMEQRIPASLMRIFSFPYVSGVRFAHALTTTAKGYGGVDAAYKNPPLSTMQVLQPELFFKGLSYQRQLGDVPISCVSDSLGAFVWSLAFRALEVQEPDELARKLRGDQLVQCGEKLVSHLVFDEPLAGSQIAQFREAIAKYSFALEQRGAEVTISVPE